MTFNRKVFSVIVNSLFLTFFTYSNITFGLMTNNEDNIKIDLLENNKLQYTFLSSINTHGGDKDTYFRTEQINYLKENNFEYFNILDSLPNLFEGHIDKDFYFDIFKQGSHLIEASSASALSLIVPEELEENSLNHFPFSYEEIAITDLCADIMLAYHSDYKDLTSYEDLIGKEIDDFIISGIFRTEIDKNIIINADNEDDAIGYKNSIVTSFFVKEGYGEQGNRKFSYNPQLKLIKLNDKKSNYQLANKIIKTETETSKFKIITPYDNKLLSSGYSPYYTYFGYMKILTFPFRLAILVLIVISTFLTNIKVMKHYGFDSKKRIICGLIVSIITILISNSAYLISLIILNAKMRVVSYSVLPLIISLIGAFIQFASFQKLQMKKEK